tara:strand:- start:86 stop:487 length:402 start_codon:yes stop_codon:yes gene_type:complete
MEAEMYEHVYKQEEILEYHNILAILNHIAGFHCSGKRKISYRYLLLLAAIDSIFDLKVTESEKSEGLIPSIIDAVQRKMTGIEDRMIYLGTNIRLRSLDDYSPLELAASRLKCEFKDDVDVSEREEDNFKGKI